MKQYYIITMFCILTLLTGCQPEQSKKASKSSSLSPVKASSTESTNFLNPSTDDEDQSEENQETNESTDDNEKSKVSKSSKVEELPLSIIVDSTIEELKMDNNKQQMPGQYKKKIKDEISITLDTIDKSKLSDDIQVELDEYADNAQELIKTFDELIENLSYEVVSSGKDFEIKTISPQLDLSNIVVECYYDHDIDDHVEKDLTCNELGEGFGVISESGYLNGNIEVQSDTEFEVSITLSYEEEIVERKFKLLVKNDEYKSLLFGLGGENQSSFKLGNNLLVANIRGIKIYEFSKENIAPTLISNVKTEGFALDVIANEDYAFVADGVSGIKSINITNKEKPIIVSSFSESAVFTKLKIENNHLFALSRYYAYSFKIEDDGSLTKIGSFGLMSRAISFDVSSNVMVISDYNEGIKLVDISDPSNMFLIAENIDKKGFFLDLKIVGQTVYLGSYEDDKLDILKIYIDDDSSDIYEIRSIDFDQYGRIQNINIEGQILYASTGLSGIHLFDISTPEDPKILSSYPENSSYSSIVSDGNVCTISKIDSDISCINKLENNAVSKTDWISVDKNIQNVKKFIKKDNQLYLIGKNEELVYIYDISNILKPKLLTIIDKELAQSSNSQATCIKLVDNSLYVGTNSSGLLIFDVSNINAIKLEGKLNSSDMMYVHSMDYIDNKVYVTTGGKSNDLHVVNVSDRKSPLIEKTILLENKHFTFKVKVMGNYLFLGSYDLGLQIFEINNPNGINRAGHYNPESGLLGFNEDIDGTFYALVDNKGAIELDFNDLDDIKESSTFADDILWSDLLDMDFDADYFYIAGNNRGFYIYDKNNKNQVQSYSANGIATQVLIENGVFYIALNDGGLEILNAQNVNNITDKIIYD